MDALFDLNSPEIPDGSNRQEILDSSTCKRSLQVAVADLEVGMRVVVEGIPVELTTVEPMTVWRFTDRPARVIEGTSLDHWRAFTRRKLDAELTLEVLS